MQIKSLVIVAVAGSMFLASCNTTKSSKVELKTLADSAAYAIGADLGQNIKQNLPTAPGGSELDMKIVMAAFNQVMTDQPSQIAVDQAQTITQNYFMKSQAAEGEKNKAEGVKFLEENGKKAGVTTTASGLQYEVLKEGSGAKPTETSTVKVHYHGTTIYGKVFDSSVDRGEPVSFPLNGVIKGWTEGLQLMTVGSKYKFYIPSELAYGERGPSPEIKPNSVLVFEVELLEIEK